MNRRSALKNIGLSLGYIAVAPSAISILQSCKNDKNKNTSSWTPIFFSKNEGIVIENLVDLILPKTSKLPGASDVNVAKFLDLYAQKAYNKEQQEQSQKGIQAIIKSIGKDVNQITLEDYDKMLAKYLKADTKQIEAFMNNKEDKLLLNTLRGLRQNTIWAYKTSELIGTEYLAYDPIPTEQKGCISLEEATGGIAWSL